MGNGTIRDNDSGLIWLKDANCFGKMLWSEALDSADALYDGAVNDCGLSDSSVATEWRLPSKEEWEAFMSLDYGNNPALVNRAGNGHWTDGDGFTGVQSRYYWSSTEYDSGNAWLAGMDLGYMLLGNKDGNFYGWPVRSDNW